MPVSLANVPIGTKLRTRRNAVVVLIARQAHPVYKWCIGTEYGNHLYTVTEAGQQFSSDDPELTDIVEILYEKSKYPTNRKASHG